jgi:hypothetical protein
MIAERLWLQWLGSIRSVMIQAEKDECLDCAQDEQITRSSRTPNEHEHVPTNTGWGAARQGSLRLVSVGKLKLRIENLFDERSRSAHRQLTTQFKVFS